MSCVSHSSLAIAASYYLPDIEDTGFGEYDHIGSPSSGINSKYQECLDAGYTITSCPEGSALSSKYRCPYVINSNLYKKCESLAQACLDLGYSASCNEGYEPNPNNKCPYDPLYVKCKCASCLGYAYTEAEANEEGYEPAKLSSGELDVCLSCNTKKYHRKPKPCIGFDEDATTCGSATCGNVSGQYCKSGDVYKYKDCTTCPTPSCPEGEINYETYWCKGALQCWWPAPGDVGCTQSACFDYNYSETVTCLPGFVKKSCNDSCVGNRYKCEPAIGCAGYDLTFQAGCSHGYESCTDTSGMKHYKCGSCKPVEGICADYTLTTKTGCMLGYQECNNGCGTITYKCRDYKAGDDFYQNGMVIGKVLEVSGSTVRVASTPRSGISTPIGEYCALMGGAWSAPNENQGNRIFGLFGMVFRDFLLINGGANQFCTDGSMYRPDYICKDSWYVLYSSCVAGFNASME